MAEKCPHPDHKRRWCGREPGTSLPIIWCQRCGARGVGVRGSQRWEDCDWTEKKREVQREKQRRRRKRGGR